jgi:16S rRNA (uracil1498-N3)-methyltransferase
MNRILFEARERQPDGSVRLTDGRAEHIRRVLRAAPGDTVRVGELDGLAGTGRVEALDAAGVLLAVTLDTPATEPWADLLLAVPRPKVLRRLWPQLAALGVRRVVLTNAARVESCYFHAHGLDEADYRPRLIEGLCQAGTTRLPQVLVRRRFKPFVEDELDALCPTPWRLLADPGPATGVPPPGKDARTKERKDRRTERTPLLAVGPEGGWTPYERDLLLARGFAPFALGPRTLRSDTACIALLAVLAHHAGA